MPPPRFSPAEHALVWAIRSAFPLNGAAAVSAPEADVDWLEVARQARKHALEPLLHAAAREGLFCPTYCLMPDTSLRQPGELLAGVFPANSQRLPRTAVV